MTEVNYQEKNRHDSKLSLTVWDTVDRVSVAAAQAQSQLKPEAEPSLAKAQPEPLSDDSHISANSGSG